MAQDTIDYTDKETFRISPLPVEQKMRSEDANEIKNIVNANSADSESRIAANEGNITTLQTTKADETDLLAHTGDTNNPHIVTKAQVGLGNADNTSDAGKPISTATQTALNLKADQSDLAAHEADQANPHIVTKAQVGLGNADNTSDADKPISDLTQTALDAKANEVATQNALNLKQDISTNANARASVDIVSASAGDLWLFRLPNTTQSRMFVVVIQYHRPDDAGRFGKSVTLSVGLGNTSGLPDRGGSIVQTGGFGITGGFTSVFIRFVGGQYYLGFTSALNGGSARMAISVHSPDAQDVDFSVLTAAASGVDLVALAPTIINDGLNLLTKENGLGNPTEEGLLLSSTIAGVRSWADLSNFGITRDVFTIDTVADNWYRIARLDSGSIWGESWEVGLAFRRGNASQGVVFGIGTTYNNARLGVHTNAIATTLCKGLRVTWAAPNWVLEFQANDTGSSLDVWGQIRTARTGVVWMDGAAGSGQVYGETRTDAQVPIDNTSPFFGNSLVTPDPSQGYVAPPINELGGEQDPPELTAAQAEDFNAEIAEGILYRMQQDALSIAYAAEADLTLLGGTAYVQGLISTPPDNLIVDRSDYITNGVDSKYL